MRLIPKRLLAFIDTGCSLQADAQRDHFCLIGGRGGISVLIRKREARKVGNELFSVAVCAISFKN